MAGQRADLIMPPKPGDTLIVEPWIETDEVVIEGGSNGKRRGGKGGEGGAAGGGGLAGAVAARRAGKEPWVEFTVGLVGGVVRGLGGDWLGGCICVLLNSETVYLSSRTFYVHGTLAPPPARQGTMRAMAPSLLLPRPDGTRHALTPPPPGVVGPDAVEALQYHAVEIADHLGLR
jgi:hypothetical protein